jgi:hypothetical protein
VKVGNLVGLRTMLEVACQNLTISPEQLYAELEQGGDLHDLKSGALTQLPETGSVPEALELQGLLL